jgi:DHA1 family bicyclomycin/chloramphenicol resistance-like MFS transporter
MLPANNPYLFAVMTLCWITAIAETDIYVPAFPEMIRFFAIPEPRIQDVLSYNFFAIFFSCLIYGPLSDQYGRKPILAAGMILFSFASLGCLFTSSFSILISFRFLQGLGASCIFTLAMATFSDYYPSEKAAIKIGYINTLIGFGMAGAPLIGSYLTLTFGWRANFWLVFALGLLSTIGVTFFYKETLPKEQRQKINFSASLNNYIQLLKSQTFMFNTMGIFLLIGSFISYTSNLSVIFITHLNVSEKIYPFYQGAPVLIFALISFFSGRIIQKIGIRNTCTLGFSGALLFFTLLALVCLFFPKALVLITLIACGGIGFMALASGSVYVITVQPFPHLKGAVASLMTALRTLLLGLIVACVSYTFNGTTTALSLTLWLLVALGTWAYFFAYEKKWLRFFS